MFTKRIIPCLDVNNGRVVKGVNFVNLRDAGDPVEIAAAYDQAGADELVFLDITASSDARGTVVEMVRKVAEKVFIPFTVGGGIRTVEAVSYTHIHVDADQNAPDMGAAWAGNGEIVFETPHFSTYVIIQQLSLIHICSGDTPVLIPNTMVKT